MRAPSAPALVPAATHRGGAATRPGPALSAAVLVLPGAVLLSAPQAGRAAVVPPGWAPLLEPAGVAAPPVPVPPVRRRPVPAAAQATPQRAELHEDGKSPRCQPPRGLSPQSQVAQGNSKALLEGKSRGAPTFRGAGGKAGACFGLGASCPPHGASPCTHGGSPSTVSPPPGRPLGCFFNERGAEPAAVPKTSPQQGWEPPDTRPWVSACLR